jgi:hypothetical protein
MSFVEQLRRNRLTVASSGSASSGWESVLREVSGQIHPDGLERISVAALFERLGVPPTDQTLEAAKKLREYMIALGWTSMAGHAVVARGRGLVSGYARIVDREAGRNTATSSALPQP